MSDEAVEKPKVAKRPHGLGRGLSALLGDTVRDESLSSVAIPANGKAVQNIEVALIHPHPEQPRRHFDEGAMQELAESIAKRGIIQPIIVRPDGAGFQIVAGERRWRAAQRAHLHRIPAIVRDFDEQETLEIALIENIQREDLNPIEEAEAYRKLIAEFHHSQEALGRIVGKSRSHVANLMRLLELPASVQQQVVEQKISMGHARALIGIPDCGRLAQEIEAKGLSVRATEQLARRVRTGVDSSPPGRTELLKSGSGKNADILALEEHLADILGLEVDIESHSETSGVLSLRYSTLDQLDMLCQRLSGERI